ncbi:MAG: efflux RND transporter permease subunit [Planctomycetes bacterium]|nr:efflux RND transporter permease subunit [Planctomycetota bacterium]
MDPIRLAIRQPVTVTVGVILILLAGAISLSRLPIQLTPNVESTVITVNTFWEGASPEEVELNIIDKQEERLTSLSSLVQMTSTSSQGMGRIRLEMRTGTDKDDALREVAEKLDQVPDYPENVDNPVIEATDRENRDYIAWIVFGTTDPDFDIRVLRDFAVDRIEPALERVPGVAEINVLGGREREIQIRVDTVRLAQYRIAPTRLVQALVDTNQNISAGRRADGKLDIRLRTIGQFESAEAIERTVLAHGDAGPVHVRDVAEVVETYKEPTSFVRSRGEPVIAINAERELGSNVMDVMKGLKEAVADLNAGGGVLETKARGLGLDGTLTLTQVYDQTVYIDDALALVRTNIWLGGGLAVIVLLLFLRSLRSVGIIAMAIPISVIGAVVAMVTLGRSINVVSLAGMAFAVGMVVDNAIVVLENIYRHLEMGKPARLAAYDGAREVWGAVLASTLTTIVVFIPILLIQEEAGQLFRDIALAICAAVGLSLVVSISVIPTAAARLMRQRKKGETSAPGRRPRGFSALVARMTYAICGSTIARVSVIVVVTAVSVFGTIKLMPPTDYLPKGNRNLVFGLIIPPPGYNIDQMESIGERVEETIAPFYEPGHDRLEPAAYERAVAQLPDIPTFDWKTQQPGDPVTPPTLENYFLVSFENILFHGGIADEPKRVVDLLPLFSHATRAEMVPGVIAFPFQVPLFQLGGSSGSAVKVQLAGPDLEEITRVAQIVYMDLAGKYGFGAIQPEPANFSLPTPEIQVRPDLVRLSELGLTTSDVGLAVRASGDGAIIDEYRMGGETIDLKIISAEAVDQDHIANLADVPIAAPNGFIVPLSSIASIQRVNRPEEIARVGRRRAVSFQVTPPPGTPLEQVIDDIETMFAGFRESGVLPPSIETSLAGSASKLQAVRAALLGDGSALGTLSSSLVLALTVVYLLLCVLFQSFLKPLVIMFSVPLATLGGFAALFAVFIWSAMDPHMPMQMLDVLTMLGFILLIGVVVNNAILIVHQTLNFLGGHAEVEYDWGGRDGDGALTPRSAIAEAVRTRVRPIFMGMLTSVGGMLPLVLMPGSGSELYRGLGSVVVGGLLVSTIFTLLLVPPLLSLVLDLTHRAAKPAPQPKPEPERPMAAHPVTARR